MKASRDVITAACRPARFLLIVPVLVGLFVGWVAAQEQWPPAPPLQPVRAAEDVAPLPDSITAEPLPQDQWQCTFRFQPKIAARQVVVCGSFNGWDRQAFPMKGPDAEGVWTTELALPTGVYEYKFLVNDEKWVDDPVNLDRVPDGFGGYNSFVRLGRLAGVHQSKATLGDGQVDVLGLAHRPPLPLFVQPVAEDELSVRYRTFAHDVQRVLLAERGGALHEMRPVSEGPLFTFWETQVVVPVRENARTPGVHSIGYTFVLEDGDQRVSDPYPYRFTFTDDSVFETPEWAKHAVWYQIMLDRFRNGDPGNDPDPVRPWTSEWFTPSPWEGRDGQTFYANFAYERFYGGDLQGLEQMLPYLKELGVNALYLNPIFKAPSYHKYDTQNYVHIDDHFGTRGDYDAVADQEDLLDPQTWQWTETDQRFLAFVKKAHEMGFKVIFDGVFNHVGSQHPAFQDVVRNGAQSRFAGWFDVTSWEPFTYKGWADFAHMPVFRKSREGLASAAATQHILNITRRWMDPNGDGDPSDGIDGWRLDVPNDVPRPFWLVWRKYVKSINPDALITGEIWNRADQWLDGHHFDAVMNYEFAKVAVKWAFDQKMKITASDAAARLAELRLAYPAAATYALQTLVDTHDTDRLVSMAQNPDREYDRQNRPQSDNPDYDNNKPPEGTYARARLVALLQMVYVGAPMVYYGDEVGMWGSDDPTCRKPMLWKDLEPYEKPEENFVMEDELAFYRQVIALRNAHPALRIGSFKTLLTDDATDVWAFLRSDGAEHVLVVLNASDAVSDVEIPLPEGLPQTWTVAFGDGGAPQHAEGRLTVHVPAVGGVVLVATGQ
ncbi:MAG: alpha-amylase family glycosyl hydrolase [Phycisphaerae bacterium]|jgi:glycosidase